MNAKVKASLTHLLAFAVGVGVMYGTARYPAFAPLITGAGNAVIEHLEATPEPTPLLSPTPAQVGSDWEQLPGEMVTLLAGGGNWHIYTYHHRKSGKIVTRKVWIGELWMMPQPVRDLGITAELDKLAETVEAPAPISIATNNAWLSHGSVRMRADKNGFLIVEN